MASGEEPSETTTMFEIETTTSEMTASGEEPSETTTMFEIETTSEMDDTTDVDAPSSGLSPGAIAGIVIGSVAGGALLIGGAYYFCRKSNKPSAFVKLDSVSQNLFCIKVKEQNIFAN